MKEFSLDIQKDGPVLKVSISGSINESAKFPESLNWGPIDQFDFDFEGLQYINSYGIYCWVQWFNQLTTTYPEIPIFFHHCPQVLVDQVNNVDGFLPHGDTRIESLYVPYYCEETEDCHQVLFRNGQEYDLDHPDKPVNFPEAKCPDTDEALELDILPEKYFHFLVKMRTSTQMAG